MVVPHGLCCILEVFNAGKPGDTGIGLDVAILMAFYDVLYPGVLEVVVRASAFSHLKLNFRTGGDGIVSRATPAHDREPDLGNALYPRR